MILPNGRGTSAVTTRDGTIRKKKIKEEEESSIITVEPYPTLESVDLYFPFSAFV